MYVETYNENPDVPTALGSDVTPTISIRRPVLVKQQTAKSNSSIQNMDGDLKPEDLNINSMNMDNYIYQRYNESEESKSYKRRKHRLLLLIKLILKSLLYST